ncbi:hypothetical protein T492DRAFT_993211, partial [Pavlovales sp. CCMP2436]
MSVTSSVLSPSARRRAADAAPKERGHLRRLNSVSDLPWPGLNADADLGAEADVVSAGEARYAMGSLTISRVARARVALHLGEALAHWRLNARAVLLDMLVAQQLVPLLTSRSRQITHAALAPEDYIAFSEQPILSPASAHPRGSFEFDLLRGELLATEICWLDTKPQADLLDADGFAVRLGLGPNLPSEADDPSTDGLPEVSAASVLSRETPRSPTPTDFSDSVTLSTPATTPSRFGHPNGLTLKQLSEGDRALSAAVERELRRAAELAKVKQRLERMNTRMKRTQLQLQTSLEETDKLKAELAAVKADAG